MKKRTPVIAGNWKMNKTSHEAETFVSGLNAEVHAVEQVQMILCAPFTALHVLQSALKNSRVQWGGQNFYPEPSGAYTGEISAEMLLDLGCSHVILGHSERREYFQENDVFVNKKLKVALESGLNPILCCGESLQERESGEFERKILNQIEVGLSGVTMTPSLSERILIAYEPIWAIGTGKTCDEVEANRILGLIRGRLKELFGEERAQEIRLLYGGSVKPATIEGQIQQPELDGALVGGASLKPDSFAELVTLARQFGT